VRLIERCVRQLNERTCPQPGPLSTLKRILGVEQYLQSLVHILKPMPRVNRVINFESSIPTPSSSAEIWSIEFSSHARRQIVLPSTFWTRPCLIEIFDNELENHAGHQPV
jgi:hypothetical protein